MPYTTNPPAIASVEWHKTGPEGDEAARLSAHVRICGADLHLEARAVKYEPGEPCDKDPEGVHFIGCGCDDQDANQAFAAWDEDYDSLVSLAGTGGFQTITIDGRDYVLLALPYSD